MAVNKKRLGKFGIVSSVNDTYYEPLMISGTVNKRILPSNSAKSKSIWQSIEGSIIAYAGGGQANATSLISKANVIGTCATRNDSVKLPTAVNGLEIYILNLGAQAAAIYPASGDNYLSLSVDVPIYINPLGIVRVICEEDGVWLNYTENANYKALEAITAYAGGGQANATQLTREYNQITVCANNGDSVKMKAALNSEAQGVFNATSKYIDCYPLTGDAIGSRSANAFIRIYPNQLVEFLCYAPGTWVETVHGDSVEVGMTAYATGGQANATQIYAKYNKFATVATGGDSCKLPTGFIGDYFEIINDGANSMDVFPFTGGNFKGSAVNLATALAATNTLKVRCYTNGEWTIV